MASVRAQTAVACIHHVIVPDYVGRGIVTSLYEAFRRHASVLVGAYVHALCDDDLLAEPMAVERLQRFAVESGQPDVIVVKVRKGSKDFPLSPPTEAPVIGKVDMASYVVRQDVFQRHVKDYGPRYAGDCDHASALWRAGYRHAYHDRLFVIGGTTRGKGDAHHVRAIPEMVTSC
jgi:hypothetical protein